MNNELMEQTPPGEFGTPGTDRSSESDVNSGSKVTGVQNGSAPLRSSSCNGPETHDGISTHDFDSTERPDATPSTPTPLQTQGGEGTQTASPAYGTPQGTVAREIFQMEQRIRKSNSNDFPRPENDSPTPGKRARRRHSDGSLSSSSPSPQKRHWDRKAEAQEAFEIADKSAKVVEKLRNAFVKLRRKEKTYSWKDFMERDNPMLDELLENQQKLASIILGRAVRYESYPEDLILRDSGTQTSPVKSTPPPTDTPDVVVLEDDASANEDLNSQNNPWGGPEIIVPVQPSTSTAGVTAQGPQQVPPQPPPLPPPYPLQPPKQQRPKSSENDAVTLVNNAGGAEFLMMQFSKIIREEVTRAIDMRLGQPDKQMPSRQKGNKIEPTRPESQKQPATSPTSPRGEPSRPGGGGGYSETWQEVVTRNYQGVRGPRAETHPSSNTSTNNRFTPLGGGDNAKRREPFPNLPPPQQPSPSTPGKRKKKGGR
nr:PREDICTED: actin cytoskeleton-regulatory complex protein pan1-like [Bemisia tabaci]